MRLFFLMLVLCVGCAKKETAEVKYPDRLPLTEQATELTTLPKYKGPSEGKSKAISEGEEAPFDGVILDETKGFGAAELRISYDELYSVAQANNKFLLTVIEIQGRELYRADEVVKRKDEELDRLRNSWWQRNKVWIGIGAGILVGAAICLATERAVLEIREASDTP